MSASPWSAIRPVLIDVFTSAATDQITSAGGVNLPFETPKWSAEWKDRRVNFIHPGQGFALYLKITSIVNVGWDDWNWERLDTGIAAGKAATGQYDVFQVSSGIRKFTLQAQIWCLEDSEDLNAADIGERLRDYIDFQTSRQKLLAVNIDFTDNGESRDMTRTIDKKRYSITSRDYTFNAAVINIDPIPTGWIEHVIMTSHEQAGSVDVHASLRMIEEELPPA